MSTSRRETLQRVVTALRAERHSDDADLGTVAAAVGWSPWHAQRTITALLGESADRHRRRLRLERAAAALLATDRRIIDLAVDAGYASHEAFTRAFTRAFGCPPRDYRNRRVRSGAAVGSRSLTHHCDTVATVGPCIHLYGISTMAIPTTATPTSTTSKATAPTTTTPNTTMPTEPEEPPMSTEPEPVERRTLSETPTLHQVRRVDIARVAEALAEMLPAVYQHVMTVGAAMAGVPYVRYLESSPAFFTIEAGIPLAEPGPGDPDQDIRAGVLPGGAAAVIVHAGPYEGLGAAHAALDRWMADNGERSGGPAWERYLTDPGEVPDPIDWRTEVVWPLATH